MILKKIDTVKDALGAKRQSQYDMKNNRIAALKLRISPIDSMILLDVSASLTRHRRTGE